MRLILVFIGFAALVLLAFFIWGDSMMMSFNQEGTIDWLDQFGPFAWLAALFLLLADLVMPLPATIILSSLGLLYGPFIGGFIGTAGSFLAGASGYWLCRLFGEKAAMSLLGKKDYEKGKRITYRAGAWVVVLSRWLPVFPEVISCMAGLTRMNPVIFHFALFCGTLPMAMIYASVGAYGLEQPALAIGLSIGLPPLIWWGVGRLIRKEMSVEQ